MSLNELFNLALRKQVGLCFQQKLVCFQQLSESINVWSLSIIGREFQIVSTAVVVNVFLTYRGQWSEAYQFSDEK